MKKNEQFVMLYAAGDLYWIMTNYHSNSEFKITKEDELLFSKIKDLFLKIKEYDYPDYKLLKNNCFEWKSEAYVVREETHRLTILEEKDTYTITFIQNPNKPHTKKVLCPNCFCLSGSINPNIATAFSLMFLELLQSNIEKSNSNKKRKIKSQH